MVSVGSGLFFAVTGSCGFSSTDQAVIANVAANTFTQTTMPAQSYSRVATDGAGTIVAVRGGSTGSPITANTGAYSTDSGATFNSTGTMSPSNYYWSGLAYGAGRFVALARSTGQFNAGIVGFAAYSTDGNTWTTAATPPATPDTTGLSGPYVDLAFGNPGGTNTFVAITGAGIAGSPSPEAWSGNNRTTIISYSTDGGDTWANATTPAGANTIGLTRVAYGGGRFIAAGYEDNFANVPTQNYWTSTNGITWTEQQLPGNVTPGTIGVVTVAYDSTQGWIIAGDYTSNTGTSAYTSTTGLTGSWTAVVTATPDLTRSAASGGRISAAGGGGYLVLGSYDPGGSGPDPTNDLPNGGYGAFLEVL